MEWGIPVWWGRFLLFCVRQSVKTKETNPTRPGSPTPCKQALNSNFDLCLIECLGSKKAASYEIPRELEPNQGSEVFGEMSGTLCTLWSRKVLTKF